MTKSANDFLTEVAAVLADRGQTYDKSGAERSMPRTVTAFNAITGQDLTEPEGWLFLQLLKDSRQWSAPTYHEDSALDSVGYAALKAESLSRDADAPPAWAPPKDSKRMTESEALVRERRVLERQAPYESDDPRRALYEERP